MHLARTKKESSKPGASGSNLFVSAAYRIVGSMNASASDSGTKLSSSSGSP